jgi:hypothetical protein
MMMSTHWILAGLLAFAVATLLGLTMALVGPVAPLSMLGAVTMLLGVGGMIVHVQLLQDRDPHAWTVLRYRAATLPAHVYDQWTRLRHALGLRLAPSRAQTY